MWFRCEQYLQCHAYANSDYWLNKNLFKKIGDATTEMSKQQEIIRSDLERDMYGAYTNE